MRRPDLIDLGRLIVVLAFFASGAAILSLGGCSGTGHTGASATTPSQYTYKHETVEKKPDGTVVTKTETVVHTGPGNEKKSGAYSFSRTDADKGAMEFKHGASSAVPFDWELAVGEVNAWPATIAGGILIAVGALMVYLGQRTIGIILIAAGGCAIALPFVAETLRLLVLIAGVVLIVAAGLYGAYVVLWQGKKINLVKKATGKDAQNKMKAKGDKAGAAAAVYVEKLMETGKEDVAHDAAKVMEAAP